LARVSGGAESYVEAGKRGKNEDSGVEAIGKKETDEKTMNEFEVVDKKGNRQERGEESETRKLAGGKQDGLTRHALPSVSFGNAVQGKCTPERVQSVRCNPESTREGD
jgi:hypothetical protein